MRTGLLIVDVLSDFDHKDGARLAGRLKQAAPAVEAALDRARTSGLPVVYANDVAGRWHEGRAELLERARGGPLGEVAERIAPLETEPLLVKGRYSAFDHTPLELVLRECGVGRVRLAGTALEMCVAQTAIDAREAGFQVTIEAAACAAADERNARIALEYLQQVVGVVVEEDAPAPQPGAVET
jgi:nicotinamidase-related amidase